MEFLSFVPELVQMLLHIKIMYLFLVPDSMTVHVLYILIKTFLFSKAEKRLICLGVWRFAVTEFKHRKVVRLKTCV